MVVCREGEDEPEGDDDVIRVSAIRTINVVYVCGIFGTALIHTYMYVRTLQLTQTK